MPIIDISQLDPNGSYTYADYLTWRFTEYVELIRGRFQRKMAAPVRAHQDCVSNLHREISGYLRKQPCRTYTSPFDVRLAMLTGNGDK